MVKKSRKAALPLTTTGVEERVKFYFKGLFLVEYFCTAKERARSRCDDSNVNTGTRSNGKLVMKRVCFGWIRLDAGPSYFD